jgi:hypothetical protein
MGPTHPRLKVAGVLPLAPPTRARTSDETRDSSASDGSPRDREAAAGRSRGPRTSTEVEGTRSTGASAPEGSVRADPAPWTGSGGAQGARPHEKSCLTLAAR